MTLSIHREALSEVDAAARWYFERSPLVADAFLEEVDAALAAIRRWPEVAPRWRGHPMFRSRLLRGFPFAVVYRPTTRGIRVLAFAHASRQPGYWRGRR